MVERTSELIKETQAIRVESEKLRKRLRNAVRESTEMRRLVRTQTSYSITNRRKYKKVTEKPLPSEGQNKTLAFR